MSELLELLLLGIASAFWPLLIAVVVVALRSPHPERLLAAFYAGALLTTVTIGVLVVLALQKSSLVTTDRTTFDPALSFAIGVLAVVAACVLRRRAILKPGSETSDTDEDKQGQKRWEKMLDRGAPLAFVVGIVADILPGFFPLVALKDIAELDYDLAGTFALVLGFYVVMLMFIELPLVGYLVVPTRTRNLATRFNDWLGRNAQRLAVYALAGVGVYLIVRAVIAVVT